jgi:hypothetical protein
VGETSGEDAGYADFIVSCDTNVASLAYPHGSEHNPFYGRGNILCLDSHVDNKTYNDVRNENNTGNYPYIGRGNY